jgi:hypothetical protein
LRSAAGACAAAACGVLLWGCGAVGGGGDREVGVAVRTDGKDVVYVNPFAARELRIHPLTRVIDDPAAGARSIEAHIELLDRFGHPVKALGQFNFTLYRGDAGGSTADPLEQLKRWSVDLSDPGGNSAVYDIVTRTYQIILTDVPGSPGSERGFELVVRFTSEENITVSSTHRF